MGHGADKAHMALEGGKRYINRRTAAQRRGESVRFSKRFHQRGIHLFRGHRGVASSAADGHHFNKTHLQGGVFGQGSQGGSLAVIDSPHQNAVDFDRRKACLQRLVNARAGCGELIGTGDAAEYIRLQSVETEVDAMNSRLPELICHGGKEHAIGGQVDFVDTGQGVQGCGEIKDTLTHQRFASGQAYAADSQTGEQPHQVHDLFKAEDVTMRHPLDALAGHAVDAAQIAAVSHRKAQIVDGAVIGIGHGGRSFPDLGESFRKRMV